MSAIYDAMPAGTHKALMVTIDIATALAMYVFGYFSVSYIMKMAKYSRGLPALQIPVRHYRHHESLGNLTPPTSALAELKLSLDDERRSRQKRRLLHPKTAA